VEEAAKAPVASDPEEVERDMTRKPENRQNPEDIGPAIGELLKEIGERMDVEDASVLAKSGANRLLEGAREDLKAKDAEAFRSSMIHPIERVVRALLKEAFPNSSEARFIFAEYRFLQLHFRNLFQEYEGSACCADKSRFVIRRLVRYFLDGERIEFEPGTHYANPARILASHEEIVDAFQALYRLHSGDLRPVADLVARLEAKRA
jgi:hypothetical protein